MRVGLLRIDVLEFAVEDEAVPKRPQSDGDGLPKERVRENRSVLHAQQPRQPPVPSTPHPSRLESTHLLAVLKEKLVGIHAVRDGAPDDGNIVEDDWGPRKIPGCELWRGQEPGVSSGRHEEAGETHELVGDVEEDDTEADGDKRAYAHGGELQVRRVAHRWAAGGGKEAKGESPARKAPRCFSSRRAQNRSSLSPAAGRGKEPALGSKKVRRIDPRQNLKRTERVERVDQSPLPRSLPLPRLSNANVRTSPKFQQRPFPNQPL